MFAPKHASFLHRSAQGAQVHFLRRLVYRRASFEGKIPLCARAANTCHLRRVQDRAPSFQTSTPMGAQIWARMLLKQRGAGLKNDNCV